MSETPWFERLRSGFVRTSDRLGDNLVGLFTKERLDRETLDGIEEALIATDMGPAAAARIRARIADEAYDNRVDEAGVRRVVASELAQILAPVAEPLEVDAFPRPQVVLVIGVNGSGKTTTIAKLAHLLQEQDYEVMLVAGDTFRAAAIGQLKVWAERLGVPIIAGAEGGDAASLVWRA